MRCGLVVRAVGLAVIVWVIACCSSLSTVIAFNDSDRAIDLKVSAANGEGWSGRLEPGASVEAWSGFRGPGSMTFVVDGKKVADALPAGFANAGSGGAEAHWRWKGRGTDFKVVVGNKLSRWMNRMVALGFVALVVLALIVRWVMSIQRRIDEKLGPREPGR